MTTYPDLLAQTSAHVRDAATVLRADRFWTPREALDAIGDYHGLLDAVASHTRRLLWPAQLGRIGLARRRDGIPPVERAAIKLAAGIEALTGEARPHPSQIGGAGTPWARAALSLRAAADLVATHYTREGRPRTPDAAHTTTATFDAGLADLGNLAQAVLAHEDPLALRAIQAGVPRGVVARQLPGLEHLADLARKLPTEMPERLEAQLDALGQVPLRPRTDDPATELTDRMVRLRQATWELTGNRSDALASLRTMAGLGIAVHAHAAAFHGADLAAPDTAGAGRGAGALVGHARAWQRLHHALSEFAILAPTATSIRDDAAAVGRLLRELAPIEHRHGSAPFTPAERQIAARLNGAVQLMADVAVHEGTTFDRLARAGLLYMPARMLPRDLVSERPDLATARLEQRLVHAPDVITGATARLYAEVASHPIDVPTAAPVGRLAPASTDASPISMA
ncbi:hypothetical protein [Cellulomonas carbonis]|uniref:Uncharacterized protein n=1 Tax=Cellulomonas carbonis T26 TaxID=947969 RepID=A0A0A0BY39_9CELL|nr:hypothetical protein [Cellulomonas carbonis]KGM12826.1 hypothetical protein N868_00580 [Cellulomonas carbonis T26]MDT0166490.1 hypothetical protein [Actinotalea sp. AC32]GGC14689.1 hypothetical protein GCM10010972_29960 [Cellulomonas carbonis]